MKVIFARSPYVITVNQATQIGAKLKLYIWNDINVEPTFPTYTLSKDIPTTNQVKLDFNISNYVREFIENIIPGDRSTVLSEDYYSWCHVKVERFYVNSSGVDTLIDTTSYVGVNGYTEYNQGQTYDINPGVLCLTDDAQTIYYDRSKPYPYLNLLLDGASGASVTIKQIPQTGATVQSTFSGDIFFNLTVPFTNSFTRFDVESILQITDNTTADKFTYRVVPVCEPKYTPVVCSFINKLGGWQFLTFFKAQTNTINVKGSNYKMMPSDIDYNIAQAQTKSFNINGQESIKLNTGWVDENYKDIIKQLFLSETILLDDVPVNIKTQSTDLKTSLKDKMINYEIEFDYAFGLINDVV